MTKTRNFSTFKFKEEGTLQRVNRNDREREREIERGRSE